MLVHLPVRRYAHETAYRGLAVQRYAHTHGAHRLLHKYGTAEPAHTHTHTHTHTHMHAHTHTHTFISSVSPTCRLPMCFDMAPVGYTCVQQRHTQHAQHTACNTQLAAQSSTSYEMLAHACSTPLDPMHMHGRCSCVCMCVCVCVCVSHIP